MTDFLDVLASDAQSTIENGYYQAPMPTQKQATSLKAAIVSCKHNAVISEIKAASPSAGTIRASFQPKQVAQAMQQGGAVAISVLTEPKHFKGSLQTLAETRQATDLPILMKDIVICPEQIDVAADMGANVVLLILALFERRKTELPLERMIAVAHNRRLEVLLETHTAKEFAKALETDADVVGINNRNLATLKINLNTTKKILQKHPNSGKTVISESGITKPADLQFLKSCGANGFLIGSAIMLTQNIESKTKEFVNA